MTVTDVVEHRVGHHDLPGPRARLKPRRRVDDVPDGREVLDGSVANVADPRDAEVETDPDGERVLGGVEPAQELLGAVHHHCAGARTVTEQGEAGQEQRHDLVADELVDDGVVLAHDRCGNRVEAIQRTLDLLGFAALAPCREPADVGEEDADLHLVRAKRRHLEAAHAEVRVLPRGFDAEDSTCAGERGQAEAAPRRCGQPSVEPAVSRHHSRRARGEEVGVVARAAAGVDAR